MSDRTSLTINYAECDRAEVEKIFGEAETEDVVNGEIEAIYEGVDGGGYEELLELAKLGVPCYGHHDEGQEYKGAYVACVGKKYREAVGGVSYRTLCIDMDLDSGRIGGLKEAERFCRHFRRAIGAVEKRALASVKKGVAE